MFIMRGLKSAMMQHHKSVANLSSGNRNNEDWFNDDTIIGQHHGNKNCSNNRQLAFQGYDLRKASSMLALPHSYESSRQRRLVRCLVSLIRIDSDVADL